MIHVNKDGLFKAAIDVSTISAEDYWSQINKAYAKVAGKWKVVWVAEESTRFNLTVADGGKGYYGFANSRGAESGLGPYGGLRPAAMVVENSRYTIDSIDYCKEPTSSELHNTRFVTDSSNLEILKYKYLLELEVDGIKALSLSSSGKKDASYYVTGEGPISALDFNPFKLDEKVGRSLPAKITARSFNGFFVGIDAVDKTVPKKVGYLRNNSKYGNISSNLFIHENTNVIISELSEGKSGTTLTLFGSKIYSTLFRSTISLTVDGITCEFTGTPSVISVDELKYVSSNFQGFNLKDKLGMLLPLKLEIDGEVVLDIGTNIPVTKGLTVASSNSNQFGYSNFSGASFGKLSPINFTFEGQPYRITDLTYSTTNIPAYFQAGTRIIFEALGSKTIDSRTKCTIEVDGIRVEGMGYFAVPVTNQLSFERPYQDPIGLMGKVNRTLPFKVYLDDTLVLDSAAV